MRDDWQIVKQFDYAPFGKVLYSSYTNRTKFIGKEKDKESNYADHGVRKYDDEIGRFTSIDPLWEKYYSLTPYQYAGNNPVSFIDPTGFAQYMVMNADAQIVDIIDDGVDDGLYYITSSDIVERCKSNGGNLSYETLRNVSYLIPKLIDRILSTHESKPLLRTEGGSVGNYEHWEDGGRQDPFPPEGPNASKQVKKAIDIFKEKHPNEAIDYYVHDHPWTSIPNSDDRSALRNKYQNFNFGFLIFGEKVIFFRENESNDVKATKQQIRDFVK